MVPTEGCPVNLDSPNLQAFLAGAQAIINKEWEKCSYVSPIPTIEVEMGPKNIRVVKREANGGSVYCFICRADGRILKAAGWKAPAPNGTRGNIFSSDFGLSRVDWHGCIGLR